MEVFLAPNEEIELVPESKLLIVTPFSLHVFGKDHCYPPIEPFHAEKGVILTGFITPPLSGVSVVFKDDDSNVINKLVTEADGRYQFGPIKAGLSYKLVSLFSSFSLNLSCFIRKSAVFESHSKMPDLFRIV